MMQKTLVILALLAVRGAAALNMSADERIVAESPDRKTVLLQKTVRGGEGGRAVSFILRIDGKAEKTYTISQTFNPGDGSKPETVREADCRKALESLKKDAQALRLFINPHACAADRDKAVSALADVEAAGAEPHGCASDEVPYFEAGCEGKGTIKCWPQKVRPTPMEACLCNGRQGNAPLPGGGLRWRHAGKCKP